MYQATDSFSHRFFHRGKPHSIFKRRNAVDAPYYVRIQQGKKQFKQSLETNSRPDAIARAKVFIDAVSTEKWKDVEKLKVRTRASMLAPVLAVYKEKAIGQRETIRNNSSSMLLIIRTASGKEVDPEKVSLSDLTETLVTQFQDAMRLRYCQEAKPNDTDQRIARERADRSSRSIVRQARSLFNRTTDILRHYKEAEITIPDTIQGFMGQKLRGKSTKREYLAPDDKVIAAAFSEIEKLRDLDPNVYQAFWLAVGAGLRKGEIRRVRWDHVIERDGTWWISGGLGKDGNRIEVPFQSRAIEKLMPFRKTEGMIISEGGFDWAVRLNSFLTDQGWKTEKKMHELRAYVGSLIYQLTPIGAMKFMRHTSIKVTETFYCRYQTAAKPVNVL